MLQRALCKFRIQLSLWRRWFGFSGSSTAAFRSAYTGFLLARRGGDLITVPDIEWHNEPFDSGREQEFFLFSKTSWPALGPTQPLIEWVRGSLPGVKRPERGVDRSPPYNAVEKNE